MWKSFIKSSFRVLARHRSFSIVNTMGLALGLSVFIALALYIQFELSFDNFHKNGHRIYRIEQLMSFGGRVERMTGTPEPLWKELSQKFPEVEASMRVVRQEWDLIPEEGESFRADLFLVEHTFLTSFSFELIYGDAVTALAEPFSMVLDESTAMKLYGKTDVVGESHDLNGTIYNITGVMRDIPANSHMDFDLLASVETIDASRSDGHSSFVSWGNNWVRLFVMLKEGHDIEVFSDKILHLLREYQGEDSTNELYTRPLSEIHLHSRLADDYAVRSSMRNIYILVTMALFVLFMAGINFTNLAIAYTTVRASEVCLRKLNGASKRTLLTQYLAESLAMTIVAIVVGFVLFESFLPLFNRLVNRQLDFTYLENYPLLLVVIATGLFTGLLSGAYPAWLISRSQPSSFLQQQMSKSSKNPRLRKVLIGIQFATSTILIIGMLVMLRQTGYMMNKELGYNPDGVIRFAFNDSSMVRAERLKETLSRHPDITASAIHDYPVCQSDNWTTIAWDGAQEGENIRMNVNYCDPDFMKVYEMELLSGNGFLKKQEGTEPGGNRVILNRAATEMIGLEDPVGKKIRYSLDYKGRLSGEEATIAGIMENFHFLSVHNVIQPFMLRLYNEEQTGWSISVRFRSEDVAGVREFIRENFQEVFAGQHFDYDFVDEFHNQMYEEEQKMSRIILYIALLANIIAALGLYGLIAYSTSLRTREVGLRKVLGANFATISRLFSREFITLVFLANLASWPLVFFASRKWLQSFPYRVGHAIWPYLAALTVTVVIAYGSMLYHTYKASRINPADSLRYE